jgi:hypothetical protein
MAEQRKPDVKTTRAVRAATVGISLACSAAAQLKEQPGEVVELKVASRLCTTDN